MRAPRRCPIDPRRRRTGPARQRAGHGLALHPFVTGQAFRHKYLNQALEYVVNHPGVWLATSDEVAEHYTRTTAPKVG
ncbi:hypothetical protein [Embleya sp. NPDC005575]|uniref:hypothetical protein n=1 Tax=Embleya sp. NPDC005575 TaxID=3156892 RepID=UPI0033BA2B23